MANVATIKKEPGRTLITLFKVAFIAIALLGHWGSDPVIRNVWDSADQVWPWITSFFADLFNPDDRDPDFEGSITVYYVAPDENGKDQHIINVYYLEKKNGKYGLLNGSSEPILEAKYEGIKVFPTTYGLKEDGKWRLYDKETLELLNGDTWDDLVPAMVNANRMALTLIRAERDGLSGAINHQGRVIIAPEWSTLEFEGTDYVIVGKDKQYGLYNMAGKQMISPRWDSLALAGGDLVLISKDDKYGLFDVTGKQIVAAEWDMLDLGEINSSWKVLRVCKNKNYGFLDLTGKVVIKNEWVFAALGEYALPAGNEGESEVIMVAFVYNGTEWGAYQQGATKVDWKIKPDEEFFEAYKDELAELGIDAGGSS